MADLRNIVNGMQVLGSDGGMVGRVTGLHEGHVHVEPDAPEPGPGDSVVPPSWILRVDDHVHLNREAALVRDTWRREGPTPAGAASTDRRAATDPPARRSWWVWAIGIVLLLIVVYLGIRGCDYAGRDPNYESSANGTVDSPDT
jgi:hypothetical protein